MPAGGYDSWTDDIERGEGYALGGVTVRHRVRTRAKWRAQLAHQLRLVVVDLAILLVTAAMIALTFWTRSYPLFVVSAVLVAATGLWFRHQRLENERRPR